MKTDLPLPAPPRSERRRSGATLAAAFIGLGLAVAAAAQTPTHPLDGLTADEIRSVVEALDLTGLLEEDARFPIINLVEPAKDRVVPWRIGMGFDRQAMAIVRQGGETYEGLVDLTRGEAIEWRHMPGVQPPPMMEEFDLAIELTRASPEWQDAMRARGYSADDRISCMVMPVGNFTAPVDAGRRMLAVVAYDGGGGVRNVLGRPIEGIVAYVDLDLGEVTRVVDEGGPPTPNGEVDYDDRAVPPRMDAPAELTIFQPYGGGYQIAGHEILWQNWHLHVRLDPRLGLVISTVRFNDRGRERDVLYQGSVSEMFVPYMDPGAGWYFRAPMDAGEFGLGLSTVPLARGVDCPENAVFFDAVMADEFGEPYTIERAIGLFEFETADVAWRHTDVIAGTTETRKKRNLVVRSIAAVGNYDYVFDWIFQQDGSIRVSVGATGVPFVKAVAESRASGIGMTESFGHFVDENLVGVNHDHFFSFRLDLDVDGQANSFMRDRLIPLQLGAGSARQSIWATESNIIATEWDAQSIIDLAYPSLWKIVNPSRRGRGGHPAAYQIVPGANALPLVDPLDGALRRAGFAEYHLWVTPHDPAERYAAGAYVNQSEGGGGLPAWTEANRPIRDRDIVAWYTMGFHHVVRAEDWPVMPTVRHEFELRPFDFFDRNPALDIPPG